MAINPNLNSLAYFEAVARTGRVSLAAAELQVSAAAVSQQLKQLEEQWGVRLFRRHERRLALTLDGEMLFQNTTAAFRMIRSAHTTLMRQRDTHQLNVRCSPSFAVRWLTPRLKDFLDIHPQWGLRVDATPDFSSFETEVIDVDLRYGSGVWEGLTSSLVVRDHVMPMCSPAYREGLRALTSDPKEQISKARLIHSVKALYQWDMWFVRHGVERNPDDALLRFDRSSMSIQLARDGAGVLLDSVTLAYDDLKSGNLVPVSPAFQAIEFPAYWFVCPQRHLNRRAVSLFEKWLESRGVEYYNNSLELLNNINVLHRKSEDGEITLI